MADVFELNLAGLNEIMKSSEMQVILKGACSAVQNAAGEGFGSEIGMGSFAAIGNVYPTNAEAAKKSYRDNTLLKALGSAGLGM